jgi:fucose permease
MVGGYTLSMATPTNTRNTATGTNSTLSIWATGVFVAIMFVALWTLALLRLTRHTNGESFLHWNGALDSALAIIAPPAVAARLWQMVTLLRKARTA